jgi:flagellar motor switch protein FliN/FliY
VDVSQESIDALFGEAVNAGSSEGADAAPESQVAVDALTPAPPREHDVDRILSLTVSLAVLLAEKDIPVESILEMTVGTILEFDASFDSELSLCVVDRPIASGQAVKVGERFGIRLTHVGSVQDRVSALAHG